MSYVGNKSQYLYENNFHNLNAVPYGALPGVSNATCAPAVNYDAYRPNSYYQDLIVGRNDAYSNYNGLQVSFNRQRGRYSFMTNYTFSKALGINSGSGLGGNPGNKLDISQNYGPLSFDRRHIFNAAYSLDLGSPIRNHAIVKGVVNGWQLSGITQFQSGVNLQPNASNQYKLQLERTDRNLAQWRQSYQRYGGGNELDRTTTDSYLQSEPGLSSHQFINAACFALPSPRHNGPTIEPEMFGPAFFNSDLSLFKNFAVGENRKLQFRFSGYNFLDHPLYSFGHDNNLNLSFGADGKVSNSNFGIATTKVGRRIIQLAVRFYF